MFRMEYIIDDEGCLFDDWYIKLTYYPNAEMKFFIVCYLIVQVNQWTAEQINGLVSIW